jgi:hypothetical protein
MTHFVQFNDVELEVIFRAMDRPDDVRHLLGLELTGAWINEAREIHKSVIDAIGSRVGQYPAKHMGGCTWSGIMMDTNPPDEDHWWFKLAEEGEFDGVPVDKGVWEFFKQPGALIEDADGNFVANPDAENIDNLNDGIEYYLRQVTGKTKAFIRVYYCNQYGFVIDGKPVIPEYKDAVHCSDEILKPVEGIPIYVGIDFGLTPAAVFTQMLPDGKWMWFDELCAQDMGISRFADLLGPKLRGQYADFETYIFGDPAGEQRAQTDEMTPFQILESKGINAQPAPTNDFTIRREAIAVPCGRLIDGKPGFVISPKVKNARKGLAGGYAYRRLQVSGSERFADVPNKSIYSHPVEAGGYAMIGAGEGDRLIAGKGPKLNVGSIMIPRPNVFGNKSGWMGA